MILIDSSAFIEYYRPVGDPAAAQAVARAIAEDEAAVCGIIEVEVVSFAPDDEAFRKLSSDFEAFRRIDLTDDDFRKAVEIGRLLRRKGFSIPATDLIIAACALRTGVILYHLDEHFDLVAKHTELAGKNLRSKPPTDPTSG